MTSLRKATRFGSVLLLTIRSLTMRMPLTSLAQFDTGVVGAAITCCKSAAILLAGAAAAWASCMPKLPMKNVVTARIKAMALRRRRRSISTVKLVSSFMVVPCEVFDAQGLLVSTGLVVWRDVSFISECVSNRGV